jgi:hypothetical protein
VDDNRCLVRASNDYSRHAPVISQVNDERMISFPAPYGGNRGIDSATSANERVMAPEPIGSHPILEPDA